MIATSQGKDQTIHFCVLSGSRGSNNENEIASILVKILKTMAIIEENIYETLS